MANGSGKGLSEPVIDEEARKPQPPQFLWDGGTEGVAGLGLRFAPGGARTWLYRYRNADGRQRFLKLGRHPTMLTRQARVEARKKAGLVANGHDPQEDKQSSSAKRKAEWTVADLAAYFEGDHSRNAGLRPNTLAMNKGAIHNHILPALGKMRLSEVTRGDVRALQGKVRAAGEAAGFKGVYQANRVLAVMSKMFALAVDDVERCAANPCKGVKKYPEDERERHLEDEEVGRLLRACAAYPSTLDREPGGSDTPDKVERRARTVACAAEASNAIRLLLFTGSRLREVLHADWSQFDLEAGVWIKPSARTKTHKLHRLELAEEALELLRDMHAKRSHSVYLFPGDPNLRRKNAPVDILTGDALRVTARHDLRRPWAAICKLAGLEGTVMIHDLRRTLASFMLDDGADLHTIQHQTGHTDIKMAARYARRDRKAQRLAMGKAGKRFLAAQDREGTGNVVPLQAGSKSK